MTKCAHALSPRAPGCPCSHRGLCTQPAPAGARGKDGLSQLEEDICIKLIKKKTKTPKQNQTPTVCESRTRFPRSQLCPVSVSGTLWHSRGSGWEGQQGKVSAVASISTPQRGSVPLGQSPVPQVLLLQCPFPELLLQVPFHPSTARRASK